MVGRAPPARSINPTSTNLLVSSCRWATGREVQLQINRPLGRPDAADVIPQDRHAAAVSFLAQTLENLLSAIRVGVQQPRDARLEGIKDTAARPAAPRLEARTRHPRGD